MSETTKQLLDNLNALAAGLFLISISRNLPFLVELAIATDGLIIFSSWVY